MLTDPDIELLRRRYEQQLPRFEEAALWAERRIREVLQRHAVFAMTSSRAKSPASFERRVRRDAADAKWGREAEGEPFDRLVTDVAGCRVMVYREIDVERASRALKRVLALADLPRSEQVHRKESGYSSTHLLFVVPGDAARKSLRGTTVEVQVVTLAGHLFNELEHSAVYKQVDESCKKSAAATVFALLAAANAADRCSKEVISQAASARMTARVPIKNAVELALQLECALGQAVHGEFELVFQFVESVEELASADGSALLGDLADLHRSGVIKGVASLGGDVDDATAILLALRERHRKEFDRFAQSWRRESAMVMRLADRFHDQEKASA